MRPTIIFWDELTEESVNNLINQIVSYDGEVDLFFSTNGGYNLAANALIHFINTQCKDSLTIYFTNECSSNGAVVMMKSKCKRVLTEDLDYIMLHSTDRKTGTLRNKKLNEKLRQQDLESSEIAFEKEKKFFKLTKEQVKNYKEGKDVYIYREDFHKIKL